MEIRSFLAFELPPEMRTIVARVSGELKKSSLDVRWVKAGNTHLTIIFMGDMKEENIGAIGEEVQKVCQEYGPFDLALKGVGVFTSRRSPRVLWLGLTGDLDRMANFRDALQNRLVTFGVKKEKRRFVPHLTLGRFRGSKKKRVYIDDTMGPYEDLASPICKLKELILFRSDLKPSGAEHRALGVWPLLGEK